MARHPEVIKYLTQSLEQARADLKWLEDSDRQRRESFARRLAGYNTEIANLVNAITTLKADRG